MEENEELDEYEYYVKSHLEKRWKDMLKSPFGPGLSINNKNSYNQIKAEIGKYSLI